MQDPRNKIREFIRESFLFGGDDELRDADSFLDMGFIDSTGVLELVSFLESEWEVSIEACKPHSKSSLSANSSFLVGAR